LNAINTQTKTRFLPVLIPAQNLTAGLAAAQRRFLKRLKIVFNDELTDDNMP
jgi:hypothetical protein